MPKKRSQSKRPKLPRVPVPKPTQVIPDKRYRTKYKSDYWPDKCGCYECVHERGAVSGR